MLKSLFHRSAVADLNRLTIVNGAYGTAEWEGADGRDIEAYGLKKEPQSSEWNLVHCYTATNRSGDGARVIATIPKIEDAIVVLRSVVEQDLKPRYAGIVNGVHGRAYREDTGKIGITAVKRALEREGLQYR